MSPQENKNEILKQEALYWMEMIDDGTLTIYFKGGIARLVPAPSIMKNDCGKYRKVVDKVL